MSTPPSRVVARAMQVPSPWWISEVQDFGLTCRPALDTHAERRPLTGLEDGGRLAVLVKDLGISDDLAPGDLGRGRCRFADPTLVGDSVEVGVDDLARRAHLFEQAVLEPRRVVTQVAHGIEGMAHDDDSSA